MTPAIGPWKALTPSDIVPQPRGIHGIYIGGTPGNLIVNFGDGDVTIPVLANTTYYMSGVVLIKAASTATPLFGLME